MLAPPTRFPRDICAYCGSKDDLTTDHIPPKCLFPKPRPDNIITVPACKKCHSGTSIDDEYFRLMLSLRNDVAGDPKSAANLDTIIRSLKRGKAERFRKSFSNSIFVAELYTTSGLYVEDQPVYCVNMDRIRKVVERIVRGLYFIETGNSMGADNAVFTYDDEYFRKIPYAAKWAEESIIQHFANIEPKGIDDDMFFYRHCIACEDPSYSLWGISFYGRVPFLCSTLPYRKI